MQNFSCWKKNYIEISQSKNWLFVNTDTRIVKEMPEPAQNLLAFQVNYVIIELFWLLKIKMFFSIYDIHGVNIMRYKFYADLL